MIREAMRSGAWLGVPSGIEVPADRLCGWAGRSRHRVVFSVRPLEGRRVADCLPNGPAVMLGVEREAGRRVVRWCTVLTPRGPDAVQCAAIVQLCRGGRGELHLHHASGGAEACHGIAAALNFPELQGAEAMRLAS